MPSWIPALSIAHLPFPVSLELVLITGRAVALIGALCIFAWAISRWRRSMARETQRVFEQLDLIQGELHGIAESVAVMAGRLEALNDKVTTTVELAPAHGTSGQRAYESAIRLAQRGMPSDDLISQCGLSRLEADLLVRLHGRNEERSCPHADGISVGDVEVAPPRKRLSVVG